MWHYVVLLAYLSLLPPTTAIALTFYRVNAPPVTPGSSQTAPTPTFSIEKPGTTLYTALNPGSSGMVPWEVKEIADKVIVHLPSTTITLLQPTERTYTVTQGPSIELAYIPPVEGPLVTPKSGAPLTLYEYGFQRYCSINQEGKYGVCQEIVLQPGVGSPTEAVATRMYTGSLMPVATIYTSLPS